MNKTEVQMDQNSQDKANHTEPQSLEEKVGSIPECISTGVQFLNITPVAKILRETINKLDLLKLRSFCNSKDIVNKTKWQHTEWEKIFTNPTSDRSTS